MFRRKKKEEIVDLKSAFDRANWPTLHTVVFHLVGDENIQVHNVPGTDMDNIRTRVADGGGVVTITDNSTKKQYLFSVDAISYYEVEETSLVMWTEDKL